MQANNQIHIASFILHAHPSHVESVSRQLSVFPEVDLVTVDVGGKIVFLTEASHERRIADIADAIRQLPNVHAVSMVEHHMDDAQAMLEEMTQ
jgi:periplasmic nitrate reductase NapD